VALTQALEKSTENVLKMSQIRAYSLGEMPFWADQADSRSIFLQPAAAIPISRIRRSARQGWSAGVRAPSACRTQPRRAPPAARLATSHAGDRPLIAAPRMGESGAPAFRARVLAPARRPIRARRCRPAGVPPHDAIIHSHCARWRDSLTDFIRPQDRARGAGVVAGARAESGWNSKPPCGSGGERREGFPLRRDSAADGLTLAAGGQ